MIKENKNNILIVEEKNGGFTLYSYSSKIATFKNEKLTLSNLWDYSRTTLKHLYYFINNYTTLNIEEEKNKKEKIKELIKSKNIKLKKEF